MTLPVHLYRYVFKAHVGPFLFSFVITTFILVMDIIFQIADLIIGKNLDLFIVLEVFFLNLAWIVAVSIPMSVLVASLMAFGRLAADNEVTALKAGGVSFFQMVSPVLLAGILLGSGHLFFMDVILPEANYRARSLMNDIHRARPTLLFTAGIFMKEIPGYSILIDRVNPRNNEIESITIYETENMRYPRLMTAKSGEFHVNETGSRLDLMLYDGELLQQDESSGRYLKEIFERQRFTIRTEPAGVQRSEAGVRGDRELNIQMMRARIDEWQQEIDEASSKLVPGPVYPDAKADSLEAERDRAERTVSLRQRQKNSYIVEIHKKYAISAACFVFVLIGAPLGVRIRRGSIGVGVGVSLCFFLLYWACLLGGEELADRDMIDPVWAMWAANIVIGVPGAVLVWVTGRDRI
ncbi:MAG: YjgP/YjgQ family permease [Gemmatimonadetes bacterium]|nr:YjgP/YjgQ family permease [Gemmatimonadota bacterium]MYG86617.1 YjgP/YjgQ family permease [Gemmatimonadota bacterium]MYJ88569.1 YjgP/YjgQ family permease [Gemmatimonadota bacterium]